MELIIAFRSQTSKGLFLRIAIFGCTAKSLAIGPIRIWCPAQWQMTCTHSGHVWRRCSHNAKFGVEHSVCDTIDDLDRNSPTCLGSVGASTFAERAAPTTDDPHMKVSTSPLSA
jgi:hypothetical protein